MPTSSSLQIAGLFLVWDAWVFTGLLVIVLPCFAYFCLFKGARESGYFGRISKSQTYLWIAGALWITLLVMCLVVYRHGLSLGDLGQHAQPAMRVTIVTMFLLVLLSLMSFLEFRKLRQLPPDLLQAQLSKLRHFFPAGRNEIIAFSVMAVSAGICEELLYRGWLLNFIGASSGSIWIGLAVSSVAFGLGHAYQGPQGIVSTATVGIVFGLIFIWIDSLIPLQVIHAFINLSSGLMYARAAFSPLRGTS